MKVGDLVAFDGSAGLDIGWIVELDLDRKEFQIVWNNPEYTPSTDQGYQFSYLESWHNTYERIKKELNK
jgi:hypothetical protein